MISTVNIRIALVSLLSTLVCSCVFAEARVVTIYVTDQTGSPIVDASAKISFPGSTGLDVKRKFGRTDGSGVAVIKEKSGFKISGIVTKNHYYPSRFEDSTGQSEILVNLRLVPKIDPVPLMAIRDLNLIFPKTTTQVGFDFSAGDWVTPYGNGSTIDFSLTMDGYFNSWRDRDSELVITFPNAKDGILSVSAIGESLLPSPHHAPEAEYKDTYSWRSANTGQEAISSQSNENIYFLRTRTKTDSLGNIESANYSKIYWGFLFAGPSEGEKYREISFSYYFSPNPNSRNLEFDIDNNIFRNLSQEQQVSRP